MIELVSLKKVQLNDDEAALAVDNLMSPAKAALNISQTALITAFIEYLIQDGKTLKEVKATFFTNYTNHKHQRNNV